MDGVSYNKKSILERLDKTPTANSTNGVTSGGTKSYVDAADGVLSGRIDNIATQITNPFTFKGTVATVSNLPSTAQLNDTYYVTAENCLYTYNGTTWAQSSMDETAYLQAFATLRNNMAPDYSNTATYDVGQYCVHDNALYVCKVQITAAEAWNSAHWEAVDFASAIDDIILVQDTQPTTAANKIWLPETTPAGNTVPEISDLENIVADEYSTSGTYSVGDYCMRTVSTESGGVITTETKLYRCISAISVAESWTPAHWEEVDLSSSIENLVLVQNSQPATTANKIWLKETTPEGINVPTMTDIENIVANEYSTSSAYAVGDYCMRTDSGTTKFYRCNTAIASGGEAWTAAHWTETKIGPEITNVKNTLDSNVEELEKALKSDLLSITGQRYAIFRPGYYQTRDDGTTVVDLDSPTSAQSLVCAYFPVTTNDIIYIYGNGSTGTGRLYGFLDSQYRTIARSSENLSGLTKVTVPTNAAYICINILKSSTDYFACLGESKLALKDEVSALSSEIEELDDSIFEHTEVVLTNDDFETSYDETYQSGGYISDTGNFTSAPTLYVTYYLEATQDMNVYLPYNGHYTQIAKFNGTPSTAHFSERYRNTDNNLPTADNRLAVSTGDYLALTTSYTSQTPYQLNLYTGLSSNTGVTSEFAAAVSDQMKAEGVGQVSKTTNKITINLGRLKYEINKYNRPDIRAYLWRTNSCYISDSTGQYIKVWEDSDSDGVVKLTGEDDFIGGYHGDETQTLFKLMIDGIEHGENAIFDALHFHEIVLYSESNVYHCNTSSTPDVIAFKRNKTIRFNSDGYVVENYWVAQESVSVQNSYMGMLSIQRYVGSTQNYLLTGYDTNHDFKYIDADTATSTSLPDVSEVNFHTIYGDVTIKMSTFLDSATHSGYVSSYTGSGGNRLKAYMYVTPVSINGADTIKAKSTITLI